MSRFLGTHATVCALAVMVTALAACTEPTLSADGGVEEDIEAPPAPEDVVDTTDDALAEQLSVTRHTVASAIEQLGRAAEADTLPAARTAAEEALALLLDDPATSSSTPALLPSESAERDVAGGQDDGLTTLLTLARDAGGSLGGQTIEVLRDPIAGDLGAWERDAAGVIDGVRGAITGNRDLDDLEEEVRELPGDATRALAWTLLAIDANDRDAVAAYAERGVVHLDFVLTALDQLPGAA